MFLFLKILITNLMKGPSTDLYPFTETFHPEKLRGKIKFDEQACVLCETCVHVCAGGAIKIKEREDKSGQDILIWHNSCAFCGLCEHYCPTKAIVLTNDYHTTHLQEDKYSYIEKGFVPYVSCIKCSTMMTPVVPKLFAIAYSGVNKNMEDLSKMCTSCRQKQSFDALRGES